MSAPLFRLVEGSTKPLPMTLQTQSSTQSTPQAFNLTGFTNIAIVLKWADGTIVKNTTEGLSVTLTTGGEIEYAPSSSSGDLFLSAQTPYRLRIRVTDAVSKVEYWPNDEEALIEVNPV